jgi:hypothetical protein
MEDRLAKLEERIEALFEGTIPRLFGARLTSADIARQVAKAMEDGAIRIDDGGFLAPDIFLLEMHPEDYILLLEAQPDLPKLIAQALLDVARGVGYRLASEPSVRFIPDLQVDRDQLRVEVNHSEESLDRTQIIGKEGGEAGEERAYLELLDEKRRYDLTSSRITIGRRLENDIVLQDPHVSRAHARIRYMQGRYILSDLDSRAGTLVNGQAIREQVLRPGDQISIAGNRFVFRMRRAGKVRGAGGDTEPISSEDANTVEDA